METILVKILTCQVTQEEMLLTWTVENREEVRLAEERMINFEERVFLRRCSNF